MVQQRVIDSPAEGLAYGDRLRATLEADPILRQMRVAALGDDTLNAGTPYPSVARTRHRVVTPWEALGEQRFLAWDMLTNPQWRERFERFLEWENPERPPEMSRAMAGRLAAINAASRVVHAVPVLWSEAMRVTATATVLPPHTVAADVLPLPSMLWIPELPIDVSGDAELKADGYPSGSYVIAACVHEERGGFAFLMFGKRPDGSCLIFQDRVEYGQVYPNKDNNGTALSMLSFMNSPYISTDVAFPTRPERRSAQRIRSDYVTPGVKVIRLRASAPAVRSGMADTEADARTYTHRWLVRGHHRAQWYPSTESHKVIWVAPYIKGPDAAPFIPPVYAVTR